MPTHEISISDPMLFRFPNETNRAFAKGVGKVRAPSLPNWQKEDYLLKLVEPFELDRDHVETLLVTPRHEGVTLRQIIKSGGAVNISRVKSDVKLQPGDQYSPNDVDFWAIGSIRTLGTLGRIKRAVEQLVGPERRGRPS